MSEPGGEVSAPENDTREFELVPPPTELGLPLVMGLALGMMLLWTLQRAAVPEKIAVAAGLGWALVTGTVVHALLRRRQADRLRVTRDTVELARGNRVVRRVSLARLAQVNELQTAAGPVLLLADDRRALAIGQSQLMLPRAYESITQLLVERMAVLDPTGERGRLAVQAGRLSDVMVQRPVRLAPILGGAVALASILGMELLQPAVASRPYPLEAIGALTPPLVQGGETWRLLSYVFVHQNAIQLALVLFGLFWFCPFVERLVGWERALLGFLGGALGAALVQLAMPVPVPMPGTGAGGGVVGLIGLLGAVSTIGRRRLPRALLPNGPVWLAAVLYMLPLLVLGGLVAPAYAGALFAGWVVGFVTLLGVELPPSDEARADLRPFAYLAIIALAVGLAGGVTHARRDHPADDDLVTEYYLNVPADPLHAVIQNEVAWFMILRGDASAETIDTAARIAEAAVKATDRKEPSILDTLAVARYRQGNAQDAKQILEEALRLDANDPSRKEIEQHLEDVKTGRPVTNDSAE